MFVCEEFCVSFFVLFLLSLCSVVHYDVTIHVHVYTCFNKPPSVASSVSPSYEVLS